MANKKFKLLLVMLIGLSSGLLAQVGGKGSVYDSSVIPKKRMAQQTEFWNNTYNFPAKPRNQWEVGVSTGIFTVSGDVPATLLTYPNFAVHVRKAFGYIFSLRLQYLDGWGKGMSWTESQNFLKNPAWNVNLPVGKRYFAPDAITNAYTTGRTIFTDAGGNVAPNGDVVYYNYMVHVRDLSLQGIVTLNNIRFHKKKTGVVIYGGVGIGATVYRTLVNALDSKGNNYRTLFNTVYAKYGPGKSGQRSKIINDLKRGMDKTYETRAENQGSRRQEFMKGTLKASGVALVGIAYKISKRINIFLEDRLTFVKDDLLDGQRWQEHSWGDASLTRDYDSYNYASIGLNLNLGGKSVEPLWWINPLDYAYDELKNHRNVKIPKNDCNDADGDGVCDHLDREPNTPAGCPVDTHGVTRDTDGDGVPDCKDKQLITPTECQPVDADGVGKCPDPECCTKIPPPVVTKTCPCDYPSLSFKGEVTSLSSDNKAMLATCAAKMKDNPTCNIAITGYPETSKISQANCQKRLEMIKKYMVEKEGISADRITINCEVGAGDKNTIDIKCNQ